MIPLLIWTTLALVGWCIQLALLVEVFDDRDALRASGRNGGLALLARHHIALASRRLVVLSGNVAVGVGAFVVGSTPPPTTGEKVFGLCVAAWLIVNEFNQVYASWEDRRIRRLIDEATHAPDLDTEQAS